MKWDYLFTYAVLSRGKQYYKDNRVQGLTHEGDEYEAWVEGNEDYQVSITLRGKKMPEMTCTCPYAGDRHKCKHMAAVLFAIEEEMDREAGKTRQTLSASQNKGSLLQSGQNDRGYFETMEALADRHMQVFPFAKHQLLNNGEEKKYRYFDMAVITDNQVFYDRTYEEAKKLVQNGLIRVAEFETGYETKTDSGRMAAVSSGLVKINDVEWKVRAVFDNERILQANCQVPGCYCNYESGIAGRLARNGWGAGKEQLCVHILALLLRTVPVLENSNPGDATDRGAQKMLVAFRRQRLEQQTSRELPVNAASVLLEPRLSLEYEGISVSFKVGTDKLYVVKNLEELVDAVQKKKVYELSQKAKIDFAIHSFAQTSEAYYGLIRDIVLGERSRNARASMSHLNKLEQPEPIKGEIPLFGNRLDRFFEIAFGKTLELNDKLTNMGKRKIRLREADPQIMFSITSVEKNRIFQGIAVNGRLPELIRGDISSYCVTQKHLNRMSEETAKKLEPLFAMADFENRVSFMIGRKSLSEFYYRVLPELETVMTIEEDNPQLIHEYLPPEAGFVFFLDVDGKNVTCRGRSCYREQEYSLLDWKRSEVPNTAMRDEQREQEVLRTVQKLFCGENLEKDILHCDSNEDAVYNLLESGLSRLMELGEVQTTEAFRRLRIRRNAKVSVGVSLQSDVMNLEILSQDLSKDELLDILYHYQKKKKYYRLKNGDFLNLEQESLNELAAMLDTLQITPKEFVKGKMNLPLYRALYLDRMLEENGDIYADRDQAFRELVKNYKAIKEADFDVPVPLRRIMRKYQIYGYRWLRTLESNHFGGILADDMGLGKTLQAIAVLLAYKEGAKGQDTAPSLVVCPASLIYNWKEELLRFAPELKTCVIAGSQPEREELLKHWNEYDVLISSYDLLKRDIDQYEDMHFAYQIIDEAQYIKNHTTAAAKAVKLIHSRTRYALTGTPIENRLSELWSIFEYLMPGFLYSYEEFKRMIETPIVKFQDEEATKQLKRMVAPFILRRLKTDVLKDLPEKIEEVRYTHLEGRQKELYDAQVTHMQHLISSQSNEEFRKNKFQILAELTKIRQICCDPGLLVENYEGESMKRRACLDMIQSAMEGEHKILLFSQYKSMLEILEKDLQEKGIPYYKIVGATPKEQRIELVRSFNEDSTPVFLISLKAGGTGLNLTGADVVIHYDPWWNVAVQNQATDRAHRIGQTRVVSVYKLIAKNTIEEKILKMQETKKDLADEILSGELGGISRLSREELLELFD